MSADEKLINEGTFTQSWEMIRRGSKICIEFDCESEYAAVVNADRLKELLEEDGFMLRSSNGDEFLLKIKKHRK